MSPIALRTRSQRRRAAALAVALAASLCSCGEDEAGSRTKAKRAPTAQPDTEAEADRGGAQPPAADRANLAETMREDLGAVRHPSDGGGRAWLESQEPAVIQAGARGRFTIVYEAGPLGIASGGAILFQVSPFWGWSTPQVDEPALPGYTKVTLVTAPVAAAGTAGAAGAAGELAPAAPTRDPAAAQATATLRPATLDSQLLGIHVEDGPLREGDRVRLVYGAGDAMAVADRFAERDSRFWIGVDGDGDGRRALVPDSPAIDIAASRAARLVAHLPSAATPNSIVPLTIAVLDATGSAGVAFEGKVALSTRNDGVEVPREVTFLPEHGGARRIDVRVGETDVVRVRVEALGGIEATTNPLAVSPDPQRILWADLHGHTNLSDGTGTPEDYFRYARDVAALDVCALTDHDHWGMVPLSKSPETWAGIGADVARFHEPGRFVALHGFEWTNWVSGHRHVLYFGADPTTAELLSSLDPRYETPALLWAALRERGDALTIAHHPAGGPVAIDWSIEPDAELEPVVEIASVHGSSEAIDAPLPIYGPVEGRFVRDALDAGYRLGFVGSGDSHDGHPGLAHLASPSGGLTAILASEATSEAVLDALRERRVYATNGPRILLRAALDGSRMGSAVEAAASHRLQIVVAGTTPLERVDVVRSGGRIDSQRAAGRLFWALDREIEDTRPGEYAYVRVVQEDGGAAWSSPFFFE